ncbi:MAG: hypothetical protein RBR03_09610 [Desulfuromonas thiophila]|jgi:hypothetical protein|nr:hypothetical protein [Desulfuromonas thiophila]
MRILYSGLFLLSFLLHGCGDDGSFHLNQSLSLSGRVADGYCERALVCLDLNENFICDDNEPSALSDASGGFRLERLEPAWAENAPLVAQIVAGQTLLHEDTGTELAQDDFILSAPPGAYRQLTTDGAVFISPLTTLVHGRLLRHPAMSMEEADLIVRGELGTAASLFRDYLAAAEGDDQPEEYARLQRLGRIVGQSLPGFLARYQQVASETEGSTTIEATAAALAQLAQHAFDYASLEQQLDDNARQQALEALLTGEQPASVLARWALPFEPISAREALASGYYYLRLDGNPVCRLDLFGAAVANGAYLLDRRMFSFTAATGSWQQRSPEELAGSGQYHLGPNGWVWLTGNSAQHMTIQNDGSLILETVETGHRRQMHGLLSQNISGLPLNAFASELGFSLPEEVLFPPGSRYYLGLQTGLDDQYQFFASQPAQAGATLEGLIAPTEAAERTSIIEAYGHELLLRVMRGSAEAPQPVALALLLKDGFVWHGMRFAAVPGQPHGFNQIAAECLLQAYALQANAAAQ